MPALATAVAVAMSETMKGVMRTMASCGLGTPASSTATESRLFAAVTSLTYENDRLQQYSRRESVRIFGIRQAEGETAEQVEQKALGVFKEAGADVKEEDIAAVHRVGKVGRGLRPILVKFVSRRKRREVMEKKKVAEGEGWLPEGLHQRRPHSSAGQTAGFGKEAGQRGQGLDCRGKHPLHQEGPAGSCPWSEPEACRHHRHS